MQKPKHLEIIISFLVSNGIATEMTPQEFSEHVHTDGECPHCNETHGGLGLSGGISDVMAIPGAMDVFTEVFRSMEIPEQPNRLPNGLVAIVELIERLCEAQLRINVEEYLKLHGLDHTSPVEQRRSLIDKFLDVEDDNSIELHREDLYQLFTEIFGYERRWMRLTVMKRVTEQQVKQAVQENIQETMQALMGGFGPDESDESHPAQSDSPNYRLN